MSHAPSKVHLIVDADYGERLLGLPTGEPTWVAGALTNQPIVKRIWATRTTDSCSHLTGITWFEVASGKSPEDWLLDILDAIEVHHGEYSRSPPYSMLRVVGTSLSPRAKAELGRRGFTRFEDSPDGFLASKPGA
jgi:hypothetical protein